LASARAGEQLHRVTTGVSKVLQYLRRLSVDLSKPKARWTETQIRNKIQRWLSAQATQNDGLSHCYGAISPRGFYQAAAVWGLLRQHCLNFLPLPQGHRSLRPVLGPGRR
jgi:hypothetical protein